MKTNLFTSILLSTLFYTTLFSTMFVMPLVLATRDAAGTATVARDVQVWDRSLYAPPTVAPHSDSRLPQTDAPIDTSSGPDPAMIKPGRARAKTIKL